MLIKIHRGTAVHEGESLCETCSHSRVIRGRRLDEEIVVCNAAYMHAVRVTFKVTSCTEYQDSREPSYHELLEKAWILRPASKRRAAGFVRTADLPPDEASFLHSELSDRD
jgi:hypothetical protein